MLLRCRIESTARNCVYCKLGLFAGIKQFQSPLRNRSQRTKVRRHIKSTQEYKGGIYSVESPIHISNINLIDPSTGWVVACLKNHKPQAGLNYICSHVLSRRPTRVGIEVRDGKRVRVARPSGEIIPTAVSFTADSYQTDSAECERGVTHSLESSLTWLIIRGREQTVWFGVCWRIVAWRPRRLSLGCRTHQLIWCVTQLCTKASV